jgi:hypothetical protein
MADETPHVQEREQEDFEIELVEEPAEVEQYVWVRIRLIR